MDQRTGPYTATNNPSAEPTHQSLRRAPHSWPHSTASHDHPTVTTGIRARDHIESPQGKVTGARVSLFDQAALKSPEAAPAQIPQTSTRDDLSTIFPAVLMYSPGGPMTACS